jgi:integrase/recombinase XerD
MQIKPTVSFYHDTRVKLKNDLFPVKIRVTFQTGVGKYKQIYFKTGISLLPKHFKTAMSGTPGELREIKKRLLSKEGEVIKAIDDHHPVTGKTVIKQSFSYSLSLEKLFDNLIAEYDRNEQIGTRDNYRDAKRSFIAYAGQGVTLDDIDKEWLEGYEKWAQKPRKVSNNITKRSLSIVTIGMYMRCLRHVINTAIDKKIYSADKYPFGKDGYVIRGQETQKQVLNDSERKTIFSEEINLDAEKKALAYWMLSYYCHGMNFTDLAHLQPSHVLPDRIVYVRRKTMRTVKTIKPLIIPIRAEVREILKEYGKNKPYCLGIIDDTMSAETKRKKIKQWYKTTNKWMNRIASRVGITFKVNSYGARHAVGRQLIEKGVHLQNIQELYGHTTITTTQVYTKGMNIEKTKELTDIL